MLGDDRRFRLRRSARQKYLLRKLLQFLGIYNNRHLGTISYSEFHCTTSSSLCRGSARRDKPPSTTISAPVTYELKRLESRNSAPGPNSSGEPKRRSGISRRRRPA